METLDAKKYADRVRRALTPQQTIEILREIDISMDDLEVVTGADQRTIRRWIEAKEKNKPREHYRDALDRLRTAVLYILLREAMDLPDISHWLRSRTFDLGPDPEHVARRPLDAIRDDQLADVIVAVNALLLPPSLAIADDVAARLRADGEHLAQQYARREVRHPAESPPAPEPAIANGKTELETVLAAALQGLRDGVLEAVPSEQVTETMGDASDEVIVRVDKRDGERMELRLPEPVS